MSILRSVIALLALAAFTGADLVSASDGTSFSCRDRVITDYGRALERMPNNRLPGEDLAFTPRGVELRLGNSVIIEREPISFSLLLNRPISAEGRVYRPASLRWLIGLRIDSVDHRGRPMAMVRQRRWRAEVLQHPERRFAVQVKSGLYRISVQVRDANGVLLGKYRQYVRVLPRRQNLRIGLRGDGTYQRGETVVARVENRGTIETSLPVGLMLERRDGQSWEAVQDEEPPSVMFEDPEFVPGGRASRCAIFTVPDDSAAGPLRVSAVVQTGRGKRQRISRQVAVQ